MLDAYVGTVHHYAYSYLITGTLGDFTLGAPAAQTVQPTGGTATFTIPVTSQYGFYGTVSFSVSGVPTGAMFPTPAPVTTSGATTLTVTVPSGTTPGTYPITITGTCPGTAPLTHSVTTALVIQSGPDFRIQAVPTSPAQSPPTITAGNTATYTVAVSSINGYDANKTVTLSNWQPPDGVTVSLTGTASINHPAALTVSTRPGLASGPRVIPLTASDGTTMHTTVAAVCVGDFPCWPTAPLQISGVSVAADRMSLVIYGNFVDVLMPMPIFDPGIPCSPTFDSDDYTIPVRCSSPIQGGSYSVTVYGCSFGSTQEVLDQLPECSESNAVEFFADPQAPSMSITMARQSLLQFTAAGSPQGGSFSLSTYGLCYAPNTCTQPAPSPVVNLAPGLSPQDNPTSGVLSNPSNSCLNQVPCQGSLGFITANYQINDPYTWYTASASFEVATFGMSCYYTTTPDEWGTPPSACKTVTYYGVTYSGYTTNPASLPAGDYCNSFLAAIYPVEGSGALSDGRLVQYANGQYVIVPYLTGADGTPVVAGRTLARDRSYIPGRGVLVDITGIGAGLLANDAGSRIQGYRLDLYNGTGPAACSGAAANNIMAVSSCNPGNSLCPSATPGGQ